jgi:hypothetical protein
MEWIKRILSHHQSHYHSTYPSKHANGGVQTPKTTQNLRFANPGNFRKTRKMPGLYQGYIWVLKIKMSPFLLF